jgi:SRSO17 transposase
VVDVLHGKLELVLVPLRITAELAAAVGQHQGSPHNETRSWLGWHRHVSLVMLAFAMLAAIRH